MLVVLQAARRPCASSSMRGHPLLRWFQAGVAAVDGRRRVQAALGTRAAPSRWHLMAVGKAAVPMARGALDVWGATFGSGCVVAPTQPTEPLPARCQLYLGAHPLPDARSLQAGAALWAFAAALPPQEPVLLLVSGGASALAEVLAPGATLQQLQALTAAGLSGGWDIATLNAQRRAVSLLKGGGLVARLGAARVEALVLSDVAGDDLTVVASGLASGGAAAPAAQLPSRLTCVGTLDDALNAVQQAAAAAGVRLQRLPGRYTGDVEAVAVACLAAWRTLPGDGLLWGGEPTVQLPPMPGRGGRNQHLALRAALAMAGDTRASWLVAGTDGVDGNTPDAGALVDGQTVRRGELGLGVTAAQALAAADSGTFLEAAGALVHTGPTDTNVGDILIALRLPAGPEGSR